ncbi:alpha-E domain-containing protein [Sphingobacterium alkalisoli]|uniref:Alpha-E domain-containing protein n=1 Tax=Sphingobacterium alkalisoli TaxID=1874115 RepID=A0A4V5LZ18_9SPHI|nr:alpha-E domain-containing protein [Sphingobacterium alkalisoli]TJY68639.1 alpha-E domain-containing protein [Sphingobacterium alkalisoli]GGH05127.1 hypothetical protein GCM10011418_01140 [Sphingobacterium alkalisoli]
MLSRVAENLFWMSRYMERTNISLRVLKTLYIAHQDGLPVRSWEQTAHQFGIREAENMSSYTILKTLIFDSNSNFSILNNVFRARENARSAQDHINRELWQSLNDYYHLVRDSQLSQQLIFDPISVLDQLIKQTMYYYGVIDSSMNRGEAYCFLSLGKLMERGLQIVDLLKTELEQNIHTEGHEEDQRWRYLLIALNGYETYLSENVGSLEPQSVLNQILYKNNFPNSLFYNWDQIESFASFMEQEGVALHTKGLHFEIGKSFSFIKYNQLPEHIDHKIQFLNTVQRNYYNLSKVINSDYFGIIR